MDKWARLTSRNGAMQAGVTGQGTTYRVVTWHRTPATGPGGRPYPPELVGRWVQRIQPLSYRSLTAAHAAATEIVAAYDGTAR